MAESSGANYLFIIDFDNTLIAKNTDREIIEEQSLIGKCISAKNWFTNTPGWAESMSYTLKELSLNNFSKQDIDNIILQIPLIEGMSSVCNLLADYKDKQSTVLLSHSNSYFIDILLKKFNLENIFDVIYTYESEWINDETQLLVKPYDVPYTKCDLCPIDFCKGVCVETHREKMSLERNTEYKSIVYIGDGTADFCAALALSDTDLILARKDYPLHKRIVNDDGQKLKANHALWENGFDVLDIISELLGCNNK